MSQKSEQEYIDDALNMVWRGKRDEKIIEALMAQGLSDYDAEGIVVKAHDATKRNIRSTNRGTAIWMMIGGVIAVVIGLGIAAVFIWLAKEVGTRRVPTLISALVVGLVVGGGGFFLRGVGILNKIRRGDDSDYLA